MPISEVIQLVDMVRRLLSRKAELDKQYFEQFILPIWERFNKVHEDHKVAYEDYLDFIYNNDYTIQQLISRLRRDSIYSANLRAELGTMLNNLPSSQFKTKDDYLADFIRNIAEYFITRLRIEEDLRKIDYGDRFASQLMRVDIIIALSKSGASTGQDVKQILDDNFRGLQGRYKKASNSYHRLRANLLT